MRTLATLLLAILTTLPVLAQERPPAGDIPDAQPFVSYAGRGYHVEVPEGWSRRTTGDGVRFSLRANEVALAAGTGVAPSGGSVVKTAHATARRRVGRATSEPDPVTGKRVPLERIRYVFTRGGRWVALSLAGPVGADNADVWRRIADSFTWR